MDMYELGPFRLDTRSGLLLRGSEPVALGRRAVALLRALVERPGALVSKDALIEAAWPGQAVEDSNLPVQIAALRRALAKVPGGGRWIETMPRRGYRYVGPVVAGENSVTAAPPQIDALPGAAPIGRGEAEHRQITALSCELVGVGVGAAGTDLEDLREAVGDFRRCVSEIVDRHNGFIASRVGNAVLVLFGCPAAYEHDAERAIRTGLELCAAVKTPRRERAVAMRCRIGIATGMVIIGDPVESGEIVGDVPNLAARLLASAQPDTVTIEPTTLRLIGGLFDCRDLGALDMNSDTESICRWQVLGEGVVASRFEALRGSKLTPLVGREEEIDLLLRRWARARAGEGQIILVSGEAGIGKSRLTVALLECLADEPHTRLRYFCSPQRADSALYPIIGQMERAAGLARDDTPQAKLDKLDAMLVETSTPLQDTALLAEMLSLPNDGRYPALELASRQRRERTLDALNWQMEALSRSSPVLMIFEDVQWIDPTSLEALARAVDRIRVLRVLLIVTFRPEFEPPWIGRPYVTALTVGRLPQRDVDTMIDQVVGDKPLPASIRRDIIERTDGIPLFVEEMTKAVLETESEDEPRRTAALVPSAAPAVPATLHASLMARLDRLGHAKELAQIGAAIGRQFSHSQLAAVVSKPEVELRLGLDRLIQAGLLYRQGVPPHATYLFKHALIQDTAYGTLLREPRRALHARIAETLECQFAEITENQPELLAAHCAQAGQIEKAARLWGKAGQRSAQRSALVEAIQQITLALDQIATLPATPALRREEIKLQVALLSPLLHVKGYGAPETRACGERARLLIEQADALGESPEDPLLLFSVLYGFWVANYMAFNGDVMRELANQFLTLAGRQGATAPLMIGHRLMGLSLLLTGDLAEGRAQLDQAIALYIRAEHGHLATRFGQDVGVASLSLRSWALCVLGFCDAALADTERALNDAREIGQATTLMYALLFAANTHVICGNYAAVNALVDELVALTDQTGSLFWWAIGIMQRGFVLALTGKASDAVQMITSGVTAWRSTESTAWMPRWLSYLARAHAELGQFDDAWRCVEEAMTAVETTKEKWCEADVNSIAGEIALLSPERDVAKAEAYFEHALAVARKQQAKSWELRAAMSRARLWRDQGKRQQARGLLASVYGWFTEGFETRDLKEAKALLDELAS
jgi:DNA-binding winged helix-turn-helix (wHTH) protein/predicted ATPase